MNIRVLEPDDVAIFHKLRLLCLEEAPTAFGSSVTDEMALSDTTAIWRLRSDEVNGNFVLGAFADESLIGVMGLMRHERAKFHHKAELWGVYVHPAWRGQGITSQLLDDLLTRARQTTLQTILLTVTSDNRAARALYLSRGFVVCGCEKTALFWDSAFFDMETMQLRLAEYS